MHDQEKSLIVVTLMMEAIRSSETSILTRATRRKIQEDDIPHSLHLENLKSYIALTGWALYRRSNVFPVRYERVLMSQKTEFFIVTAVNTSNLTHGMHSVMCKGGDVDLL
jgi:hypothetical protein